MKELNCDNCTCKLKSIYMVYDNIWFGTLKNKFGDNLCLKCLKEKLPKLTKDMFTDYPCNHKYKTQEKYEWLFQ